MFRSKIDMNNNDDEKDEYEEGYDLLSACCNKIVFIDLNTPRLYYCGRCGSACNTK